MKKKYRLRKNHEWQTIIKQPKFVINSPVVKLLSVKNNLNHLRIGITISKKIKSAVVRNLIKRRTRSIARQFINILIGFDIIIIVKQVGIILKYQDFNENLTSDLKKLFKKITH